MGHGQPDFGMYAPKETVGSLADMAELAVRLGSIDSYDRRGDVLILDDFESTVLKWYVGVAMSATVTLSPTSVKSGAQAVKILTDVAPSSNPFLRKWVHPQASARMGYEVSFSLPVANSTFETDIIRYDGVKYHTAQTKIDFTAGTLVITDKVLGAVTLATGLTFHSLAHSYHTIKLVVDFSTDKYVRLLLNSAAYDLSAYILGSAADATTPSNQVYLSLINDVDGATRAIYLDDFILTRNEP